MKVFFTNYELGRTLKHQKWFVPIVLIVTMLTQEIVSLNGSYVCTVKQKYNVTKRVKYRAPMSVRTYEWCFAVPPRCSKWTTEMRDLTRIETEERIAEVAICCPGYKIKDVTCVPICPHGKTGSRCSEDCPSGKWGPNCANLCNNCSDNGACSPITGECVCQDGWKGERCELSIPVTTSPPVTEPILTTTVPYVQSTQTIIPHSTLVIKPNIPTTVTPLKEASTMSLSTEKTEKVIDEATTRIQQVTTSIQAASTTQTNRLEYNPMSTEKKHLENEFQTAVPNFDINYINYTPTDTTVVKRITEITTQRPEHPKPASYSTVKPDVTSKVTQVTNKLKPKEIWIRPAQKGDSTLTEIKTRHEIHHPRLETTKKEISSDNTTPRTIIVSIIPTSVAYTTFKKISLTTSSLQKQSNETLRIQTNVTKRTKSPVFGDSLSTPMSLFTIKLISSAQSRRRPDSTTINSAMVQNISSSIYNTSLATKVTSSIPTTNSFTTNKPTTSLNDANKIRNFSSNNNLTTKFSTNTFQTNAQLTTYKLSTKTDTPTSTKQPKAATRTTEHNVISSYQTIKVPLQNISSTLKKKIIPTIYSSVKATTPTAPLEETKNRSLTTLTTNVYENTTTISTTEPEDETFHILTEPEHITAVIGERGGEKSSLDLVSVVSIAGGVMMAVITVAVVVVMIERCRRTPYQRVRKANDLRMKVIMETGDIPPPYTRSIFHTPLPDPPTSEKCHYQPISTLDRNVKQFMRPVIVQAISPVMLENFRGIIECHYDHLPKRSYDDPLKVTTAPSVDTTVELPRGPSFTDSVIDAMKCEATFDVIDHTTSEPLYAEIPAWRPPSEHAIEIINLNGEAVTEL